MNRREFLGVAAAALTAGCAGAPPTPGAAASAGAQNLPPKLGLALGGGAARGFAHVGVIKMLEAQGIKADYVVGTSAGSVVGALYAAGYDGFQLQEMAFDLDRSAFADWQFFGRGLLKGQALQDFINDKVGHRRIEQLPIPFACVAAKLRGGEAMLFKEGDVGLAVRASSAVPGVFMPARIGGEEYVDGGTVSPVPVRYTRALGADLVIAVDIAAPVTDAKETSTLDTALKAFSIMGTALTKAELPQADVVIAPDLHGIGSTDFADKQRTILEGEKAALAQVATIKALIAAKTRVAYR